VRALGVLYAKAQASSYARSVYAAYALEKLRLGMSGQERTIGAVAESAAARSGIAAQEVSALLQEAELAKDGAPLAPGADHRQGLDLVRRLTRILRQAKGGTG
jgi:hypothetical protein